MTTATREQSTENGPQRDTSGTAEADRQFRKALNDATKKIAPYLPPGASPVAYFAAAAMAAKENPEIYECTVASVLVALVRVVQTGLVIGTTCFLVPFWNKKRRVKEVKFVAHYKGLIELAYDSGYVAKIHAVAVRDGERFEPLLGDEPRVKHWPDIDSTAPVVAAYAVAQMVHAGKIVVVLSAKEIDAIRQEYSALFKKGELPKWYAEKTAIRHLANHHLPLSRTMRLALAHDAGERIKTWAEVEQEPDNTRPQDGVVHGASAPRQLSAPVPAPRPVRVTNAEDISPAEKVAQQERIRRGLQEPEPYAAEGPLPWEAAAPARRRDPVIPF